MTHATLGLCLALVVCGCGADAPPMPAPLCDAGGGMTQRYVISRLHMGALGEDLAVPGLNLDGAVSVFDGETGCGHGDTTAPPPFPRDGIDNSAGLWVALGDAAGIVPHVQPMKEMLQAGGYLLVVEVSGVASDLSDSCVGVRFLGGRLPDGIPTPALSDDGWLAANQALDVDASPVAEGDGYLDGPWLHGRASSLTLPFITLDADSSLEILDVEFSFFRDGDRIEAGVIAGVITVDEFSDSLCCPNPYPTSCGGNAVQERFADMGDCDKLSIGYFLQAEPVSVTE